MAKYDDDNNDAGVPSKRRFESTYGRKASQFIYRHIPKRIEWGKKECLNCEE